MESKYLIVDKEILPDYFDKVVEARKLLADGQAKDVSDAVKKAGISRSTYYKYKDYLIEANENSDGHKAIISMMLRHEQGVLSELLLLMARYSYSVWTITQNPPIHGQANVVMTLEISNAQINIDDLLTEVQDLPGVVKVSLVGVE